MLNIVLAMLLGAALAQEEPAPTIADLEAQALYKLGLELIAAEQWDQACAALTRVWIDHPHHELAMLAREKTHWIADAQKGSTCRQHSTVAPSEAPNSGRTELVVSQAIVGPITLGVLVPLTVPPLGETTTVPVLLGLTGLGLGIGGTYAITEKHPVTTGQAMAIGTGEMVGALNAMNNRVCVECVGTGSLKKSYPR